MWRWFAKLPSCVKILVRVWVWLSLVEYLNGVQGVEGSNPFTQTTCNDEVGFEKIKSYLVFLSSGKP